MRRKPTVFDKPLIVLALENMAIPASRPHASSKDAVTTEQKADMLWWLIQDDAETRALPAFSTNPKVEQNELVRTIGARMREARELANMSQQLAAERLGYANGAKLAKIEHASDTNSVPLYLIPRAAKLYDVSVDFLLGLTADWEGDLRSETNSFLVTQWEEARRRDLEAMNRLYRRVQTVARAIDDLVNGSNEISAALRAVRERGGEFDDLPAGNRLLCAIERQTETARQAEGGLRRFRAELLGKAAPVD